LFAAGLERLKTSVDDVFLCEWHGQIGIEIAVQQVVKHVRIFDHICGC
jgi:hypothetical protein